MKVETETGRRGLRVQYSCPLICQLSNKLLNEKSAAGRATG
jgi:hypothetical protein